METRDYFLRRVPKDLMDRVKAATELRNTTIRRVLLTALIQFDMEVERELKAALGFKTPDGCIIPAEVPDGPEALTR